MFGPNTYFKDKVNINYSHRDIQFFNKYKEVIEKFKKVFNLDNYDIILIPGSATVGIETLISSLKVPVNVVGAEGTFKTRWTQLAKKYYAELNSSRKKNDSVKLYCSYETSCSTYHKEDDNCFIDATSGFPYYDIPENSLGFVTSLNKQLSSYIGIAIVGIRKDCWHLFKSNEEDISYLNLSRYHHYAELNQGPTTFPTFILEHFSKVLDNFDIVKFRKHINDVCQEVLEYIPEDKLIGDLIGPCITFKSGVIPEDICKKYDLYGYWAHREHIQMFTYNGSIKQYRKVLKEISKNI